jgi:hypothetical protein
MLVALGSSIGCVAPGVDDDMDETFETGELDLNRPNGWNLWPTNYINVCFDDTVANVASLSNWRYEVQWAVERNWGSASGLHFVGWRACTASNTAGWIRIAEKRKADGTIAGNSSSSAGYNPDGNGIAFGRDSRVVTPGTGTIGANVGVILHEFGHALGFSHEFQRTENATNPDPNCPTPKPTSDNDINYSTYPGDTYGVPYYSDGVMNHTYCSHNTSLALSDEDIASIRRAYGPPSSGSLRADFNGDGRMDMLITTTLGTYLYLGKSDGTFTANTWVRTDLPLGKVRFTPGDFNGDGRTDLVITTAAGSFVYQGSAGGTFKENVYVRHDLPLGHAEFTPGDFNGDGRTDLMIATRSGSYTYLGNSSGTFSANTYVRTDMPMGWVHYTPGDYNGDGRTDLMMTTTHGSFLYLGRANGSFTPNSYVRTDLPLGIVKYTAGDFNGDGRSDLVVTTPLGSFLYHGKSDGKFVENVYEREDLPLGLVSYTRGNFNGDQYDDLMITTPTGSYVYLGKSTGFTVNSYVRGDLPLGRVLYGAGDFNGDSRTDLAITTMTGTFVYQGKADGTFKANVYTRGDLRIGVAEINAW